MKSHEEEKVPNSEELLNLVEEGKFPTLEEFQKFNPFYESEKARLEFSAKRRLLRKKEQAKDSTQQNEKNDESKSAW